MEWLQLILIFLLATIGTAILGLLFKWLDRKVTGLVQWRVGPPIYQPLVDIFKLLGKETLVPTTAHKAGFLLAPLVGFSAVCVAATILWSVNLGLEVGFIGDLIVVLYLLTIPSLMTVLGSAISGNPYATVGASREIKMILSYELPFVLALLPAIMHSDWTLRLEEIMAYQAQYGVALTHISVIIGFIMGILVIQAKLGLVPFDAAEAETEITEGVYIEYSGAPLAVILLTRAMLLAVLPLFLITVFWGGLQMSVLGVVYFILKYVLIIVLTILIRNTNPRLRIDQSMNFFWLKLAPLGIIGVIIALSGY